MNWENPIVADVRRIREDLSARFNFDVWRYSRTSGLGRPVLVID